MNPPPSFYVEIFIYLEYSLVNAYSYITLPQKNYG